jgi:predicted small lipoprotein YifL
VSVRPLRVAFVIAVAATLAVAACGRRGSPVLPPGQRAPAGTVPADPDKPAGPRTYNEPFFLDPLL